MTLVTISVKIERELLEKIDALARVKNKNRSIIIREALAQYINMSNTNVPVMGNTIDMIEFFESFGSQIIQACKEKKRKLEKELMISISPYELYKFPEFKECRRIKQAVSSLLWLGIEA